MSVCLISPDLALVRMRSLGAEERWTLPASAGDGAAEERDASWWKGQAVDAGRWVAHHCAAGRRVEVVCVDVSESSCVWLSAPSADPDVVAAALRQGSEEWEALDPGATVQPILRAAPGAARKQTRVFGVRIGSAPDGPPQPARMPVIVSSDAMVRLWLDELNKCGVRIGVVASLWHAMAAAWTGDDESAAGEISGAVIRDGNRLVWCWARARRLLTGGSLVIPNARPAPREEGETPAPGPDLTSAVARLSLDWLAWAAQIGDTPLRVRVVGEGAAAIAKQISDAWPDTAAVGENLPDPLAATMERVEALLAAGGPADGLFSDDDPRESLVALSRRRGRAHQRLYTGVGATCALLAVGIGALGWRESERAGALRRAASESRDASKALVAETSPDLANMPSPRMAALSALEAMRKQQPSFSDPPPARPILDEANRLLANMSDLAARGLQFDEMVLHEGLPSGAMTTPDFETGEELASRLRAAGGRIRWDVQFERRDGNLYKYRLNGQWLEEPR